MPRAFCCKTQADAQWRPSYLSPAAMAPPDNPGPDEKRPVEQRQCSLKSWQDRQTLFAPRFAWACATVSRRLAHGFKALAETMRENHNV